MKKQIIATGILLMAFLMQGIAQTGILKGKITDKKTNEELVGAAIVVDGTTIGTITNFMGAFEMPPLTPGTYAVKVQYISYETMIVGDVVVKPDETTVLNLELMPVEMDIQEVQVVAKANRELENLLLLEQKKAVIAKQAIGARELSRKGVSNAQGAVTKIAGISRQDGIKNVFVRGLGDRYNTTTFNGFPVPSEDPEYKNISLDFFSSDIIESVGVNKAFTANNYGDVSGAIIDINSKQLFSEGELSVDVSGGVNTSTATEDFMVLDGVNALGFSNKSFTPTDLSVFGFNNKLDPGSQSLQINRGLTVAGGKKYMVGENRRPLTFYAVGSYTTDFRYVSQEIRNTNTGGAITQDQIGDKYQNNSRHMLMGNLDYSDEKYQFAYNTMLIHTNSQSVGNYYGLHSYFEDSPDFEGVMRRQQLNDNVLFVNQLMSMVTLSDKNKLDLGLSYNYVNGDEPDRRINYLSAKNNGFVPTKGTGAHQRYFSTLKEDDMNLRVVFNRSLGEEERASSFKLGYAGRYVKDNFEAIEYDFQVANDCLVYPRIEDIKLDDYFNQTGLDNNDFRMDRNADLYEVTRFINSAFVNSVFELNKSLFLDAGLRFDQVNLTVDYNVNRGGAQGKSEIDKFYALPSLNLKYALSEKNALRFGVSRTYTMPQSKEISPFRYVGMNFRSQGNPDLQPSDNYNIDLKWDYFITSGEVFSVTTFYKHIVDPISRVEKASAGGFLTYDNIAPSATAAGVEFELRKDLFSRKAGDEGSNRLSFGLNGSYIYTNAEFDDENFTHSNSQLEGAAPVIINSDLSYNIRRGDRSFINSLVFNYFSDRVYTIGTQGFEDIIEEGVPTIDFVSTSKLNKSLSIKFKASNLLNPDYELSREPSVNSNGSIVLSSYKKGLDISLGLSYNF